MWSRSFGENFPHKHLWLLQAEENFTDGATVKFATKKGKMSWKIQEFFIWTMFYVF